MDIYDNENKLEEDHLLKALSLIKVQLEKSELRNDRNADTLLEDRKNMQEDTVSSNIDFDRMIDIFQYLRILKEDDSAYRAGLKRTEQLKKMLLSPYFARVDFKYGGDDYFEKIYIGHYGFTDEETLEYNIYDWRAPISSLFYRFEMGKAHFTAPVGKIEGEIGLKRQYEINNGKMEYYFDANVQIVDEFLRKLLSKNTSDHMKTIVETIQKDQDIIIRDMKNDLLIVQGAAGSGKTSVALHRAAYLMYDGLTERLSRNNIIILSPNQVFEKYISAVLPELGEENIISVTFEDIFSDLFKTGYKTFQSRNKLFENLINCDNKKRKYIMKQSLEFKTSDTFITVLERFMDSHLHENINFIDIYYDDKCIIRKEELKERLLLSSNSIPLELRLRQIEKYIFKIVKEYRPERREKLLKQTVNSEEHMFDYREYARMLSIKEHTDLVNEIQKFTVIDYKQLYLDIFKSKEKFFQYAEGLDLPDCINAILDYTNENMKSDVIQYEDILAASYIKVRLGGADVYKNIHQVIIDEAQDYYSIHYKIISEIFKYAKYTVLGDINQTIEKQEEYGFYENVKSTLNKNKSCIYKMQKSFRSTNEIIDFSSRFIDNSDTENFNRAGEKPEIYKALNNKEYTDLMIKDIISSKDAGYRSIGIICKSEKKAKELFKTLNGKIDVNIISGNNMQKLTGVIVIPVYMAKGLEFDAVLIHDADRENYNNEDDRKLLYVASTRALHKLSLFYKNDMSPLI